MKTNEVKKNEVIAALELVLEHVKGAERISSANLDVEREPWPDMVVDDHFGANENPYLRIKVDIEFLPG